MVNDDSDAAHERSGGIGERESVNGCGVPDWTPTELGFAVTDFPVLEFSNKRVLRAGEALRGNLVWMPETKDEIVDIFRVASSWRDSHAFPMRSIRGEVSTRMVQLGLDGITVARIKRMTSIRRKLRRLPYKLNQIQDLGGVRSILASMEQVHRLAKMLRAETRNEYYDEDDYLNNPKVGGYRSLHIIYKFNGTGESSVFDGRRIEIQVRTRLQHAWATAVEAIGLLKNQELKAGEGDPDWLRLFELISAEFALAENCPEPPNVPPRPQRIKEIRELDQKLGAVNVLESLRFAAYSLNRIRTDRINFYLVEYDHDNATVDVRSKFAPKEILLDYGARELENNIKTNKIRDVVLIEAEKVEDLKNAYPNYFGDVQVFTKNLRYITKGKKAIEYTMPPIYSAPRSTEKPGDLSWLRPGRHRRWK